MKITVEFDSEDEFKARIKNPRGVSRGGTSDDGEAGQGQQQAPAPLMPPQGQQFQPAQFVPPQTGIGANPFPAPQQQPIGDPVVAGLVQRISARITATTDAGQNPQAAQAALDWFRGQCGAEASAATMDQIKTVFLPKLTVVALEQIAKLMGA